MNGVWRRVPPGVRASMAQLPQTRLLTTIARRHFRRNLRILGFHGVADPAHFEQLITILVADYHPVDAETVAAATRGESILPEHAVWVTFDDGLHSTFEAGHILQRHGVPATAFVCPATVAEPRRLWFQTVADAEMVGLRRKTGSLHPTLAELKAMPDRDRRAYTDRLEEELQASGRPPPVPLSPALLHQWIGQGHSIGNHTWDHPCLDACRPEEQQQQIVRAHSALAAWGIEPTTFAYPNGNYAATAEATLHELGYATAVLYDHRINSSLAEPLWLSRLRVSSDATSRRIRSIASGAHPTFARAVLGRPTTSARPRQPLEL